MKKIISKPRKLLSVVASEHWSVNDNPHNNTARIYQKIIIATDKGTYAISGCPNCSALWWKKIKTEVVK